MVYADLSLLLILSATTLTLLVVVIISMRRNKKLSDRVYELERFLSSIAATVDVQSLGLAIWKDGELVYINSRILDHAKLAGVDIVDRNSLERLLNHPENNLVLYDVFSTIRELKDKRQEYVGVWRKEIGGNYVEITYARKNFFGNFYGIVITRNISHEFSSVENEILRKLIDVLSEEIGKELVDLRNVGERIRSILCAYGLVDIFGIALLQPDGSIYYPFFKYSDDDDRSGMAFGPEVKNLTRYVIDKSIKVHVKNSEKERTLPDGYQLLRIRGEEFTIYAAPIVHRFVTRGAVLFEKQGENQFSDGSILLFDKIVSIVTLALYFIDIFQEAQAEKRKFFELSIKDYLTGAYSRLFLEQYLSKELAKSKRMGTPLSVVFLDIDHFKETNDKFGHVYGDEVLRTLVRIAQANLRVMDLIARYGGDEFVIVLPNTSVEAAKKVMERISELMRESNISISFGVIDASTMSTIDEIYSAVDRAMYETKVRKEAVPNERVVRFKDQAEP